MRALAETLAGTTRRTARWEAHLRKGRNNTIEVSVFKGRQDRTARGDVCPPVPCKKKLHPWSSCLVAVISFSMEYSAAASAVRSARSLMESLSCAIFTNLEGDICRSL